MTIDTSFAATNVNKKVLVNNDRNLEFDQELPRDCMYE